MDRLTKALGVYHCMTCGETIPDYIINELRDDIINKQPWVLIIHYINRPGHSWDLGPKAWKPIYDNEHYALKKDMLGK